jgi:hypothetical protein
MKKDEGTVNILGPSSPNECPSSPSQCLRTQAALVECVGQFGRPVT